MRLMVLVMNVMFMQPFPSLGAQHVVRLRALAGEPEVELEVVVVAAVLERTLHGTRRAEDQRRLAHVRAEALRRPGTFAGRDLPRGR